MWKSSLTISAEVKDKYDLLISLQKPCLPQSHHNMANFVVTFATPVSCCFRANAAERTSSVIKRVSQTGAMRDRGTWVMTSEKTLDERGKGEVGTANPFFSEREQKNRRKSMQISDMEQTVSSSPDRS